MREITKFLQSLKPEQFFESSSTSSVYYVVAGLKIRLADHFTPKPKDSDIQIICPINNDNLYIVTIKEGLQVTAFTDIKELSTFISNYALFHRIKTTTENMKVVPSTETKKLAVVNASNRTTSDAIWGQTVEYIRKDFPEWDKLQRTYKRACKALFASPTDYDKCIELMKDVFGAETYSRQSVDAYFEPYINANIK